MDHEQFACPGNIPDQDLFRRRSEDHFNRGKPGGIFARARKSFASLLRQLASQRGSGTPPAEVDRWFSQCAVEKASKREFLSPVHAEYANDFELRSNSAFSVGFSSGMASLGVNKHPWMSIVGYSPEVTLNNAEVAALTPTAAFFEKHVRLYDNNWITRTPFPDTPRLEVKQTHLESFKQLVLRARLNPKDFHLRYIRYYVTSAVNRAGKTEPQPLIAHAYSRTGASVLKITFSWLPLDGRGTRA